MNYIIFYLYICEQNDVIFLLFKHNHVVGVLVWLCDSLLNKMNYAHICLTQKLNIDICLFARWKTIKNRNDNNKLDTD